MAWLKTVLIAALTCAIAFAPHDGFAQTTPVQTTPVQTSLSLLADTPQSVTCPAFLPAEVRCYSGRSKAGALFFIARPRNWNNNLIVFAHGGPRLGPIQLGETIEDLEKFQILVRAGYAWAGTTYRRGGWGVRSAAQDVEDLRAITWAHFGRPERTLLHGQSWGGNIAAKAGELYALDSDGAAHFDGLVLTSAVLAGGTRAYQMRADLRAVFQYYCRNHPSPNEATYPVWQGLPVARSMSRAELSRRVQECTGVGLQVNQRSQMQKQNLANITRVLNIGEDQILPNLIWATNTFQDLIGRLNGRNPFSNANTRYRGSSNDRALNAGVERFSADPAALAKLAYDSDLSGLIVAPVITLHGMADAVAPVCHQSAYRQTLTNAGRAHLLFQTFTSESEHSRLEVAAYPAVFDAMVRWTHTRIPPTMAEIVATCQEVAGRNNQSCKMLTNPTIPNWPC